MNGKRKHAAHTQEKRNTQNFHSQNLKTTGADGRVILEWARNAAVNCSYYMGWVKDERVSMKCSWTDIHREKNPSNQIKKIVHLLLCHHKLH